MRFLQPQYLKLFLVLVALVPLWLIFLRTKYKTRLSFGQQSPLEKVSRLSPLWRDVGRYALLNLVLAGLIVALAHPQRIRDKKITQPKRMDIVFLLDTSPSMRAQDIPPSRLERALEVIGGFAHKKLPDDRLALVSFAEASLILSYLTEDPNNILYYLDYMRSDTTPSFGTNIGRALKNSLTVITKELEVRPQAARYHRVFILLSDGEDHGSELEAALTQVKRTGIKVHTVGIGSKEGAPIPLRSQEGKVSGYKKDRSGQVVITKLNEELMTKIAKDTGGLYFPASPSERESEWIYRHLQNLEKQEFKQRLVVEREDHFQLFLGFAIALLILEMLIGDAKKESKQALYV